jgi:D-alanyl-D-alanine carboxypeptidase
MLFPFAFLASAFCLATAAAENAVITRPIPDDIWSNMQGKSWHSNLPCLKREDLVLLEPLYWNFEGAPERGQIIVAAGQAKAVAMIFSDLFTSKALPIQKMKLVDAYGGNDDASMADNNTSGFNCRTVGGSKKLSSHARGTAIDINPLQNPYVILKKGKPAKAQPFDEESERKADVQGLIKRGSDATAIFKKHGWVWGGDWKSKKDYQHISSDGQ